MAVLGLVCSGCVLCFFVFFVFGIHFSGLFCLCDFVFFACFVCVFFLFEGVKQGKNTKKHKTNRNYCYFGAPMENDENCQNPQKCKHQTNRKKTGKKEAAKIHQADKQTPPLFWGMAPITGQAGWLSGGPGLEPRLLGPKPRPQRGPRPPSPGAGACTPPKPLGRPKNPGRLQEGP